jgi:hypothetical protein
MSHLMFLPSSLLDTGQLIEHRTEKQEGDGRGFGLAPSERDGRCFSAPAPARARSRAAGLPLCERRYLSMFTL